MDVRVENHYGVDVFVSVQAEAARQIGCLCVHEEDGKTVMCRHLRANIQWEEKASRGDGCAPSKEEARNALMIRAPLELESLVVGSSPFNEDDGCCGIALINYAVCLSGNLAMAITRCPYYEAEVKEGASSPNIHGTCIL